MLAVAHGWVCGRSTYHTPYSLHPTPTCRVQGSRFRVRGSGAVVRGVVVMVSGVGRPIEGVVGEMSGVETAPTCGVQG